jgi:glycerate 2-kinase
MTAPTVPLEAMQALTSALLASGARIDEINTLRRHLDRVKGGGIAQATKARVLSLILSDVVGNPLEAIASGPTAPDPTTKEDALAVLEKYDLLSANPRELTLISTDSSEDWRGLAESILQSLRTNAETIKHDNPIFSRVQNVIVGDNALAVHAALRQAEKEGFQAESLGSAWQGEAREVGIELAQKLRVTKRQTLSPFCLVAGGETTVTLTEVSSLQEPNRIASEREKTSIPGSGGRNQELALAAVPELAGLENALLISLATDGEDGPTDAAGSIVLHHTPTFAFRFRYWAG